MSISAASVNIDGATVSATGGTASAFKSLGGSLGSKQVVFDGDNPLTRSSIYFNSSSEKAKVDAPNGYSQVRRSVKIKIPLILDNGATTYNTVVIQLACDVETSESEITELQSIGAQVLVSSALADFWRAGSTE